MTQSGAKLDDAQIAQISRSIAKPIVLVGLMGAGKTSVGRKLAGLMKREFFDADAEIEAAAQLSVAEIFEKYGEHAFRDGERRVIARLIGEPRSVIATGGGAFVDAQTRALLLERGVVVWIDCDLDTLVERTSRRNTRPLLREGNPRETLERLMRERASAYGEAHVRVHSDRGPQLRTAMEILKGLAQWT